MENIFLKMKPWHLFMLMVGFPMLLQLVISGAFVTRDPQIVQVIMGISVLILFLSYTVWMYSVATAFHPFIPPNVKINMTLFRLSVLVPAAGFIGGVVLMMTTPSFPSNSLVSNMSGTGFALLTAALLLGVCSLLYAMSVAAKIVKAAYSIEKYKIEGYTLEFYMMVWFPIGLWMLQSKVNKVYQRRMGADGMIIA